MSKQLLAPFGFPFTSEAIVDTSVEAGDAADAMGYPVVVKLNGSNIAHKTERGLVRLQLADRNAVEQAAVQLLALATVSDGKVQLLVARMINGSRELIVGMVNDPVFGNTAMLGIGGIFAEVIQDVVFAPLPIDKSRALEMIDALKYKSMLQEFRGERAVNVGDLADALVAMSAACDTHKEIVSIDINPLIVQRDGSLVAVDALVEVLSTAEFINHSEHENKHTNQFSICTVRLAIFAPRNRCCRGLVAPRQVWICFSTQYFVKQICRQGLCHQSCGRGHSWHSNGRLNRRATDERN